MMLALGLPTASRGAERDRQIENLRTFAKLYGYVRFFHPSDEASQIEWDRFAILGARRVKDADSAPELKNRLEELFMPIAPSARVFPTGQPPEPLPTTGEASKIVAWQHLGVGLGPRSNIYRSVRLNRPNELRNPGFGTVTQSIDAAPHRGRQIKLRAVVRTDVAGKGNQGQLWLRVDRPDGARGFFDNMGDRPILSAEWQSFEIEGEVANDADRIVFGGFLRDREHLDGPVRVIRPSGGWGS